MDTNTNETAYQLSDFVATQAGEQAQTTQPVADAPSVQPELEIEQGDIVEYVQDEEALAEVN